MSGGRWNYQSWQMLDNIDALEKAVYTIKTFTEAIAQSEHIVDRSESGDSVRRREDGSGAERDLYDLWLKTFDEVFGDVQD